MALPTDILKELTSPDNRLAFDKALLKLMLKEYVDSATSGGAIYIQKGNFSVRYESSEKLLQAIKSLRESILFQENPCMSRSGLC